MILGSIGCGHIGSAVLNAVLNCKLFPPEDMWISSPIQSELDPFSVLGCHTLYDNQTIIKNSDLILLMVRPNQLDEVLNEIGLAAAGKVFLSVCAGVTTSKIRESLPNESIVMRAMPNLPISVGAGATALYIPYETPEKTSSIAKEIFSCCGRVVVMDEEQLNAATAVNGSGPGYFFRIASVMESCAYELGIPRDSALELIAQTMIGAGMQILRSGKTPGELASSVAVPGGTTEAAFKAFDEAGLNRAIHEGMLACKRRADEL